MKASTRYTPGKWTSGDHAALFIETPQGTWKAMAHKDDSSWSVRGPDPDDPLHYADGEVFTADADVKRGNAEGRYAAAKKRARAYIVAQTAAAKSVQHATKKTPAQLDREIAKVLSGQPVHSTQRPNWWQSTVPEEDRVCYDTKTKALKAFLDTNYAIIENYGGADYEVSPSEFDSINHKYGLRGNRVATTIAKAVWAAMPEGKPFCLDRIDIDALNSTSPARESDLAFQLPDHVYEANYGKEMERYYRGLEAHARICRRCRRPLV